jgi:hypothetical protein
MDVDVGSLARILVELERHYHMTSFPKDLNVLVADYASSLAQRWHSTGNNTCLYVLNKDNMSVVCCHPHVRGRHMTAPLQEWPVVTIRFTIPTKYPHDNLLGPIVYFRPLPGESKPSESNIEGYHMTMYTPKVTPTIFATFTDFEIQARYDGTKCWLTSPSEEAMRSFHPNGHPDCWNTGDNLFLTVGLTQIIPPTL